jgi:hypothetical protein
VLIVLGLAGFVHIVYSSSEGGLRFCAKESWSIAGTFVNVDELTGRPILSLLDRASTVRALVQCEVLELPQSWRR